MNFCKLLTAFCIFIVSISSPAFSDALDQCFPNFFEGDFYPLSSQAVSLVPFLIQLILMLSATSFFLLSSCWIIPPSHGRGEEKRWGAVLPVLGTTALDVYIFLWWWSFQSPHEYYRVVYYLLPPVLCTVQTVLSIFFPVSFSHSVMLPVLCSQALTKVLLFRPATETWRTPRNLSLAFWIQDNLKLLHRNRRRERKKSWWWYLSVLFFYLPTSLTLSSPNPISNIHLHLSHLCI